MPIGTTRQSTGRVFGKVQFDPTNGTPLAFSNLGYSVDGFTLSERPLINDVYSDRNGGSSGEPVDVQLMGKIATLRGRTSDFDHATVARLRQVATKTLLSPGQVPEPGCLLGAEGEYFRLLLEGEKDTAALSGGGDEADFITPLNFNIVVPRDVTDIMLGSKVTEVEFVFTCYTFIDAGDSNKRKLWNRDTTQ